MNLKTTPIQVAIVDDHELFSSGLASLLRYEAGIEVAGVFDSPLLLLDHVPAMPYDVILLDINMPEMNGLEALSLIFQKKRAGKVIILSTYNEQHLIDQARKQGAMGYLFKNAHRDDLVLAIKEVYAGQPVFPEERLQHPVTDAEEQEPIVRFLNLTQRERELLQYMTTHATSKQISAKLHISYHTVKTHRKNIMRKLHLKSPAELIAFVMKHNLLP